MPCSLAEPGRSLSRSRNIPAGFVDEPRPVENADKLVGSVMQRLTEGFADELLSWQAESAGCTQVAAEEKELAFAGGDQRRRVVFPVQSWDTSAGSCQGLSVDKEHVA
jgi:hypothetical protein